jgi:UDP-glucose 4-epimerase
MTRRQVAIVTGGAGFIGSHMVDTLMESNYDVRVIDNLTVGTLDNLKSHQSDSRLTVDETDIRNLDPSSPVFRGVNHVFHFAGIGEIVPSIENPTEYMDVNIQGTVKVLEGARHNDINKFVYAASSSCYGLARTPTSEDHPIEPKYPYALSKYLGETACFHWHQVYGLPVNSIRIFNAFGTRQRTSGTYGAVFGVFLRQKLAGTPFTVVGDGTQTRDFLYVSDVASAFLLAANTEVTGRTFNLGAGDPQPVNRLVELLGGDVTYIPKRPGEPDCTWAKIDRIKNELGWEQQVSFEDGVAEVVENIEYWRNAPLWNPESIGEATQTWFKHMPDEA